MSDFMKWLYARYIKPELEASPPEEYARHLSLAETNIVPHAREDFEKAAEYVAIHAFLLGVRTGCGLSGSLSA